MISADRIKVIFKQNIQIISTLLGQWKKLVCLDKVILCKMLTLPESKSESQLWRFNAIEIVALAVCFNIPIAQKPE